jgi:DNA-binding CsgD family transcriptional regulator
MPDPISGDDLCPMVESDREGWAMLVARMDAANSRGRREDLEVRPASRRGALRGPGDGIETIRALAASALDALDALEHGVILEAPDGAILFANSAAEAMLAEADGLLCHRGRFATAQRPAAEALRALAGPASEADPDRATTGRDACAVQRLSGRSAYAVVIRPLPHGEDGPPGKQARHGAVLFLADADRVARPAPARLASLYALTGAEAEIASRLADGDRIGEVAAAIGVSENTVKTHQKAIFEKIGVNRQAQLVRRIAVDLGGIGS